MASKTEIGKEFARRANQFHPNQNPMTITTWGLFGWGDVSKLIKTGEVHTHYKKHNKIIWCKPSQEFYDKWVKPYINWKGDTTPKINV